MIATNSVKFLDVSAMTEVEEFLKEISSREVVAIDELSESNTEANDFAQYSEVAPQFRTVG